MPGAFVDADLYGSSQNNEAVWKLLPKTHLIRYEEELMDPSFLVIAVYFYMDLVNVWNT